MALPAPSSDTPRVPPQLWWHRCPPGLGDKGRCCPQAELTGDPEVAPGGSRGSPRVARRCLGVPRVAHRSSQVSPGSLVCPQGCPQGWPSMQPLSPAGPCDPKRTSLSPACPCSRSPPPPLAVPLSPHCHLLSPCPTCAPSGHLKLCPSCPCPSLLSLNSVHATHLDPELSPPCPPPPRAILQCPTLSIPAPPCPPTVPQAAPGVPRAVPPCSTSFPTVSPDVPNSPRALPPCPPVPPPRQQACPTFP